MTSRSDTIAARNLSICSPYFGVKGKCIELPLFRLGGPGLGNLLFAWARAVVISKQYSLRMMYPTWPSLKIGPYIRRERDKRHYVNLFHANSGYVHGIEKYMSLLMLPKVTEEDFRKSPERYMQSPYLIRFTGMAGFFSTILKDHNLVREELLRITRQVHKKALNYDFSKSVSLHVRMGDFIPTASFDEIRNGLDLRRIPLNWYARRIVQLKEVLGNDTRFYIFSDGSDRDLSLLLKMEGVRRISFGSALADLLALSYSRILIANGSTFSNWASYLGRMPVIWPQGQVRHHLYAESEKEVELDERSDLPSSFIRHISKL